MSEQTTMKFDVAIVGGGPAGLATGIRLAQLCQRNQCNLNICIIEKGAEIGSHLLSGAVLDPRAANELIPDWQQRFKEPLTPVTKDQFLFLTQKKAWRLPTPSPMKNQGHYIISLDQFSRFLAKEAENLNVQIFPGFAVTEALLNNNHVTGVRIGAKGIDRANKPKATFQPNIDIFAKQIVLAEGCHGSVTQKMIAHFNLQKNASPQTYGLGIKEIWEIPPEYHKKGSVTHTVGYPLDNATYGGSFIYHFGENLLSIGFVVGLDYQNPYLNPYETFQCFKSHRAIYPLLATGRRIAYGARALSEGGLQSIPKLTFPGGIIIGDAAGLLNVPKMKGIHHAMKSGIVAGDSLFELLKNSVNTATPHALTTNQSKECTAYPVALKKTWLWRELYLARNIRPGMRWGLLSGLLYAALDTYLFRGRAPWTLKHAYPDNSTLQKADQCQPISYPKHDQCVTFDLATSLHLAHIQSDEDEPCHLKLKDEKTAIEINLKQYASPETRYCPAGVYEIIYDQSNIPKLVIHASNCIHCKACDIKDPTQNITWTPPEGGSGPQYEIM